MTTVRMNDGNYYATAASPLAAFSFANPNGESGGLDTGSESGSIALGLVLSLCHSSRNSKYIYESLTSTASPCGRQSRSKTVTRHANYIGAILEITSGNNMREIQTSN